MNEHRKRLIADAKAKGFINPDEYIMHCEMLHTIRSVERAFDRAFILEDPPVFLPEKRETASERKSKRNKKTR